MKNNGICAVYDTIHFATLGWCLVRRVLIITDSLGCPREEYPAEVTWVEQIIADADLRNYAYFYTFCVYGLSSKDIPFSWIHHVRPDVVISEIGVVDACRDALKEREKRLLCYLRIDGIVRAFCSRHHYALTRLRDIHSVEVLDYVKNIKKIESEAKGCFFAIEIFPPGEYMKEKTYQVEEDINRYNHALKSALRKGSKMLQPLSNAIAGSTVEKYILATDGHHLSKEGHELVCADVKRELMAAFI